MDHNQANRSINCTVHECKYHSGHEDYCSLDAIQIGAHESNPTSMECTDCESFKVK